MEVLDPISKNHLNWNLLELPWTHLQPHWNTSNNQNLAKAVFWSVTIFFPSSLREHAEKWENDICAAPSRQCRLGAWKINTIWIVILRRSESNGRLEK